MTEASLYPRYIVRPEAQLIRGEADLVRESGTSRAVLLYGPGGVGKTSLVRGLARTSDADDRLIWLHPIDVDDPEFWLLSNLERMVVDRLDPGHRYFGPYVSYLSRLPSSTQPRLGHETVVSHLGRIKRVFVDCYREFVSETGSTVAMIFDTVEAIRGVYLLYTLTQWMKALPGTLFILSGRPQEIGSDPILSELMDPHQSLPVTMVLLGRFAREDARRYLDSSSVAAGLSADEREKLVLLSRGHPLWLAFTISYLNDRGIPEEALRPLEAIEQVLPYGEAQPPPEGHQLEEEFKRRLVTPYQGVDFWHEAIKRLAVVRQSVNREVWRRLMDDQGLPETASDLDRAWEQLLGTPWIRPRANGRYASLHDAVAEELAQRIIPLHDQEEEWRRYLWVRSAKIYDELTKAPRAELERNLAVTDERLRRLEARLHRDLNEESGTGGTEDSPDDEQGESIRAVARLDARKRELDQLRAASLYYQLLHDYSQGSARFLELFAEATDGRDVFFQDRLALEMQLFLPGSLAPYPLDDVVRPAIASYRRWLEADGREQYLQIVLRMADYLIENERSDEAIRLLDGLPDPVTAIADEHQLCRVNILKGNAYMRIPDRVRLGIQYLDEALSIAQQSASPYQLAADAFNEKGYYYRHGGLWTEADDAYRSARDEILAALLEHDSDEGHKDLASIQTNWAYLKGLRGDYREGTSLVESAIKVRRRLGLRHHEGISWSVCGEVHRYERQFQKAWDAYTTSERIFQGQRNWSWLGIIYQQQAICLYQAARDNVTLRSTHNLDPLKQSRRRMIWALDICRDQNVRAYPSALNRAGRIFGQDDLEAGLGYLQEGIVWARRLSDGWFWYANLVEYAELSYRAYAETGEARYRDGINAQAEAIGQAAAQYSFPDLTGRWNLLQGHLAIYDDVDRGDPSGLDRALEHYKDGFMQIAGGYVGSSGAPVIPREFAMFRGLFMLLSPDIQAAWRREFRRAWRGAGPGQTQLLARLEELY